MLALVKVLPFLLVGVSAQQASSFAGATSSDVFTATATGPDTSDFPEPSVVGYAGPTPSKHGQINLFRSAADICSSRVRSG